MLKGPSDFRDVENRFIGLTSATAPRFGHGSYPCQGLYWTPKGKAPKVAMIATHYNVDFAEHYIAPYMAERGYGFLGWNTRFRGAEDQFLLEHALIDIGVGVRWLKSQGVEKVVLLGNSGGGSLMGAYQAEAQNLTLPVKGVVEEELRKLDKADLYISLNAHPGRPEVLTGWIDASVTDETDPTKTDPALDPFNPDNGPPYSQEFIARYRAAQRARNQRITDWCKTELARINALGYPDRLFPMFRTWADLRFMDPAIDPSDRPCPGCYRGDPKIANRAPSGIGRANTLKTFLSMWSLETSQCRGEAHLRTIALPSLVIQSTADMGVFPSDAKIIFEALGASDKSLEQPKGAHYFEDAPEYRDVAADIIAGWLSTRI
jgi:pimeloyl-ACP methyl ester carboxylesterase